MKLKHTVGSKNRQKTLKEERSFLLGNNIGDYLWLGDVPESRYQGWFITNDETEEKMYKVIDDIRPVNRTKVKTLENKFSRVVRSGKKFKETFELFDNANGFVYKTEKRKKIELVLDMRESYSTDQPNYRIEKEGDRLIITAEGENNLILAITGFSDIDQVEEQFVRNYELDKERNSYPYQRTVFKAVIMTGKKLFFSASKDRATAVSNLKKSVKSKKNESKKEPIDFIAAKAGLENLVLEKNIYAGFPWFFQFWKRDTAISLRGLYLINKKKAKDVFWALIEGESRGPRGNKIVDGPGWVYKRAFLFLNQFDQSEKQKLSDKLFETVNFDNYSELKLNKKKETWMDSISRDGARIELQALRLSKYKLGRVVDKKRSGEYERMEKELRKKVKKLFWDGSILADGYHPEVGSVDKTIRPNIFLAYYIYPELLSREEWKKCFRKALDRLWLDWGGLATVDKTDYRFHSLHTGENPESYHQGDSWFFVNNLAAVAMNRLDDNTFTYEIKSILEASREDLLWNGAIGHHSEVSSAEKLRAQGTVSQAWSLATYLEIMYEIVKINNYDWA